MERYLGDWRRRWIYLYSEIYRLYQSWCVCYVLIGYVLETYNWAGSNCRAYHWICTFGLFNEFAVDVFGPETWLYTAYLNKFGVYEIPFQICMGLAFAFTMLVMVGDRKSTRLNS